jgi:hypothetical protein
LLTSSIRLTPPDEIGAWVEDAKRDTAYVEIQCERLRYRYAMGENVPAPSKWYVTPPTLTDFARAMCRKAPRTFWQRVNSRARALWPVRPDSAQ